MEQQTGTPPPALQSRPTLKMPLAYYVECFHEVSSDRSYAQGQPLRLSTMQIEVYRRTFEIADKFDFHSYIRMIDQVYLLELDKFHKSKEKS